MKKSWTQPEYITFIINTDNGDNLQYGFRKLENRKFEKIIIFSCKTHNLKFLELTLFHLITKKKQF